ncbi:hypothetical protein WMY93_002213 [Mugilogobius chulae]|uniref:Fas apoptotic inhibitory molecule 1 n=1 Tax=Mugilogobius chulae TaxID=88201 RepID=A0AAW0Q304_9GOBI
MTDFLGPCPSRVAAVPVPDLMETCIDDVLRALPTVHSADEGAVGLSVDQPLSLSEAAARLKQLELESVSVSLAPKNVNLNVAMNNQEMVKLTEKAVLSSGSSPGPTPLRTPDILKSNILKAQVQAQTCKNCNLQEPNTSCRAGRLGSNSSLSVRAEVQELNKPHTPAALRYKLSLSSLTSSCNTHLSPPSFFCLFSLSPLSLLFSPSPLSLTPLSSLSPASLSPLSLLSLLSPSSFSLPSLSLTPLSSLLPILSHHISSLFTLHLSPALPNTECSLIFPRPSLAFSPSSDPIAATSLSEYSASPVHATLHGLACSACLGLVLLPPMFLCPTPHYIGFVFLKLPVILSTPLPRACQKNFSLRRVFFLFHFLRLFRRSGAVPRSVQEKNASSEKPEHLEETYADTGRARKLHKALSRLGMNRNQDLPAVVTSARTSPAPVRLFTGSSVFRPVSLWFGGVPGGAVMSSDLAAIWEVALSDRVHHIEFEHGTTTGKRVIYVDGKEILRRDWMFKLVGKETFCVGKSNTKATINIDAVSGFAYEYTLEINGKSLKKYMENRSKTTSTWLLNLEGTDLRVVLEKDTMDVWCNGHNIETAGEFVDDGTETHFTLSDHLCCIKAVSSGKRKDGIIHTLIVDGTEVPECTE